MNRHLRQVIRGTKIYREYEILRYGEIREKYWKCYDHDGYALHSGHFDSLDSAIKQLEGIR